MKWSELSWNAIMPHKIQQAELYWNEMHSVKCNTIKWTESQLNIINKIM